MREITLLISGRGTNARAVIEAAQGGMLPCRMNGVIADRDCTGKAVAFAHGIPFTLLDRALPPEVFSAQLLEAIPKGTDFIVLAGFLSRVPNKVLAAFPQQVINMHPSLLPKFGGAGMYGLNVHRAVLKAGETETGCTVHYVTPVLDGGAVIAQAHVPVIANDTPETLQARVRQKEHELLITSLGKLLADA